MTDICARSARAVGGRGSLLVAALLALWPNAALAEWELRPEKVAGFALGGATSIAVHEASHYVVARVQGFDMEWHGLRWTTDGKSTALQMAGLAANALSSEAVLSLSGEERSSYLHGWLLLNMVEQLTYSTLRYNEARGDFGPVPEGEKRIFAAFFLVEAAVTGYRLYRDGGLRPSVWFGREPGEVSLAVRIAW